MQLPHCSYMKFATIKLGCSDIVLLHIIGNQVSCKHAVQLVKEIHYTLSFISLKQALPAALSLAPEGAHLIALIKPQFEAGRGATVKGIVKDAAVHCSVCAEIENWLEAISWNVIGLTSSPVEGSDGNREFLVAARKGYALS